MQRPDGMRPFLVVRATHGRHTRFIAEQIVDRIRVLAYESELRDARSEPLSPLQCYSAVTLAAPVRLGHHDRRMVRFVRAHRHELAQVPTLLLSVSLTDPDSGTCDDAWREVARTALDELVLETGWLPGRAFPVAGSLDGSLRRSVVRTLFRLEGPDGSEGGVVSADRARLHVAVDALVREAVERSTRSPPPSEAPAFRTAVEGAVLAP